MTRGQRLTVMMRIPEFGFMLALLLLVGSIFSHAETCGVDTTDPENMHCGPGSSRVLYTTTSDAQVQEGLSYDFYQNTCPTINTVIQTMVASAVQEKLSQIPGLIRLAFHDCFIQGCDASVLLNTSTDGEQEGIPNKSLRPESLELISQIKAKLEGICPNTVSCADIVIGAGAAVIQQAKGPSVVVPYGRRDSLTFQSSEFVTNNLPSPFNTVAQNLAIFNGFNLDLSEMITLTGAHSVGRAHCGVIAPRLTPTVDPDLDATLAATLKVDCPNANSDNTVLLDPVTPYILDINYYKRVLAKESILASDSKFDDENDTKVLVQNFANDNSLFLQKFNDAFVKLSQINVLTGSAGQIRTICNETNSQGSS